MTTHAPTRRTRFKAATALAVVTMIGVLAGCDTSGPATAFDHLDRPDVPSGTRYIDEVYSNVSVTSDVHYSTADQLDGTPEALDLDVYQPADDTATNRPAVVVAHGGGFTGGDKTLAPAVELAEHFAKAGYVAVSINYRVFSPVGCGHGRYDEGYEDICNKAAAAATTDAQAAVRWLRKHADNSQLRIDPDHIAMTGTSAGAVMSILVGSMPGLADDPTNPASVAFMHGAPHNASNPGYPSTVSAWSSVSGGLVPQITDMNGGWGQYLIDSYGSDAKPAPGYFFNGTADEAVDFTWAEATRDQLLDIGTLVGFRAYPGLGHVAPLFTHDGPGMENQMTWFFAYLMGLVPQTGMTTG